MIEEIFMIVGLIGVGLVLVGGILLLLAWYWSRHD
jgi:hypothetical protein